MAIELLVVGLHSNSYMLRALVHRGLRLRFINSRRSIYVYCTSDAAALHQLLKDITSAIDEDIRLFVSVIESANKSSLRCRCSKIFCV